MEGVVLVCYFRGEDQVKQREAFFFSSILVFHYYLLFQLHVIIPFEEFEIFSGITIK